MLRFGAATALAAFVLIGTLQSALQARAAAGQAVAADRTASPSTDVSAAKAKKTKETKKKKAAKPQPSRSGGSSGAPAGDTPDRGMGGY